MVASPDRAELDSPERRVSIASGPVDTTAPARLEASAFRDIYEAHFKLVWTTLRRLGVREADVMDVTQKVFITAYMKLDQFEGRSRISTWLIAICQRVASDHRRSAAVRREVATDESELDLHSTALDDSASTLAVRRRAALAETILDKLPEAQRVVFVLFELEELSGPEIAAILEISVGTVRSRLRLARETFAREVKRLGAMDHFHQEQP